MRKRDKKREEERRRGRTYRHEAFQGRVPEETRPVEACFIECYPKQLFIKERWREKDTHTHTHTHTRTHTQKKKNFI